MTARVRRSLVAGGAAATAVALAAAYVLATAGPATARPFATLDVLQGDAEVQTASATAFHQAIDGETLHEGDTVRTEHGRVEIEYFDGSVTRLDHETTFTLTELASTPEDTQITGEHASGSTFNRVVELTGSESRFDVETPSAIASVRGTTFFTQIDPDGSGLLGVLDGELLVTGEAGEARLIAGRGVTVTAGGDVSVPFVLTAADLDSDWLFYNLCVLDHVLEACSRVLPRVQEPPEEEPEPEPPPVVVEESTVQTASAPPPEPKKDQGDDGEPPPPDIQQEPPPPPPPPPPEEQPPEPPPPPPDHPGNPPCDNPGQGTPCDGPGNAGNPPGNAN